MRYELDSVLEYTRNLQILCQRTGVATVVPNLKESFKVHSEMAEKCLEALRKEHPPTKHAFEAYAQSVWVLAKYLKEKRDEVPQGQMDLLAQHLRILKKEKQILFPDTYLTYPKRLYTEEESYTPAAKTFINSELFQKLKNYSEVLCKDRGPHFFGLLCVSEKKHVAGELVKSIEREKTIDGIQAVFEDFYHDKNPYGSTNKNKYDLLNTGRDIFTFVLGFFGLLKTTTAGLVDQASEYAFNTNEVYDEKENSNLLGRIRQFF
ncbi:hypothetical protein EAS68_05135 [Legionella jordanis]|uniref:hypothetical protein n=1 Tax=Legionella jordanis TaxID=456 RepID=UPI000EFEA32B|nr:hypothetical protein [Legionella jordanis]RMX21091.1 hypothetical protein EAS68_05135 [Legionella jordanis]